MRILVAIPHYFGQTASDGERHESQQGDADSRTAALESAILSLHQNFGESQAMIHHADRRTIEANQALRHTVHVVVAAAGAITCFIACG
jgi:hypothetical protein